MDLSTIDNHPSEKGVSLIIKDTEGNDTDIKITVISMKSNKAQKLFLANKDENVAVYGLLTIGWENMVRDGKNIECTPSNASIIYADYPLIGNQVAEAIMDAQNILKKN